MRKFFSFVAIAAMVAGMVSCGGNNDVRLKKFQITVEDITYTSAKITIEPQNEQVMYKVAIVPKNLFDKDDPGALNTKGGWSGVTTGKSEKDNSGFVPGNKYVVAAIEVDAEGNVTGDIDFITFETNTLPYVMAETPDNKPIHFTGELNANTGASYFSSVGACTIENTDLEIVLCTVKPKKTGHFTTDDIINYMFTRSYVEGTPQGEEDSDQLLICGADYNVTYDDATGEYSYEGWIDTYESEENALRIPFTMTCTEAK